MGASGMNAKKKTKDAATPRPASVPPPWPRPMIVLINRPAELPRPPSANTVGIAINNDPAGIAGGDFV